MKTVLMSGGSGGIGSAIRATLEACGYRVVNIGRTQAEIVCDLQDAVGLEKALKTWLKTNTVDVLIHCAGVGVFEPHETLSAAKIKTLVDTNLTAPLVITSVCLRALCQTKGHVISIASVEATRHAKYSALYTATKSGLRDFGLCLFEEVRKQGVRVTTINPDMTKTPFFDTLHFEPSACEESYLLPQTLAQTVKHVLETKGVVTDITVRPQRVGIAKKPLHVKVSVG